MKGYKCWSCGKVLRKVEERELHAISCKGVHQLDPKRDNFCTSCDKAIASKNLKNHFENNCKQFEYFCEECNHRCGTERGVAQHKAKRHGKQIGKHTAVDLGRGGHRGGRGQCRPAAVSRRHGRTPGRAKDSSPSPSHNDRPSSESEDEVGDTNEEVVQVERSAGHMIDHSYSQQNAASVSLLYLSRGEEGGLISTPAAVGVDLKSASGQSDQDDSTGKSTQPSALTGLATLAQGKTDDEDEPHTLHSELAKSWAPVIQGKFVSSPSVETESRAATPTIWIPLHDDQAYGILAKGCVSRTDYDAIEERLRVANEEIVRLREIIHHAVIDATTVTDIGNILSEEVLLEETQQTTGSEKVFMGATETLQKDDVATSINVLPQIPPSTTIHRSPLGDTHEESAPHNDGVSVSLDKCQMEVGTPSSMAEENEMEMDEELLLNANFSIVVEDASSLASTILQHNDHDEAG